MNVFEATVSIGLQEEESMYDMVEVSETADRVEALHLCWVRCDEGAALVDSI